MQIFKRLIVIGLCFCLVTGAALTWVTAKIYDQVFDRRFEKDSTRFPFVLSDFPQLSAQPMTFHSGGSILHGNLYTSPTQTPQNQLIIFCHGLSNGSSDYLPQIAFFAEKGYEVLAYDNTGSHDSTGNSVGGIPQSVVNLKDVLHALTDCVEYKKYSAKPWILMGHSWGGYAVNAVLNEKNTYNIHAVVSFSAPNKSADILTEQGKKHIGQWIYLLKPFIGLVEQLKFGECAGYTALDGANNTSAPVLVIQGKLDHVVSYGSSLASQASRFSNPNATVLLLDGTGHRAGLDDNKVLETVFDFLVESESQRRPNRRL